MKALIGASSRYLDWITYKPPETRTAEEIIDHITSKLKEVRESGPV